MTVYGTNRGELNRKRISEIKGDLMVSEINKMDKNPNEDTIQRKAIQSDIIKLIKEGKGRIEAFDYLWNKYKDTKLCIYISQWYEHFYAKIKEESAKKNAQNAKENEGR